MIEEQVILVDPQGRELGVEEKMQAHRDGVLHLAFSVLLYRDRGNEREFLMQQRALGKYHSGGLWTNTCCSHPRQGESMEQAGIRRLAEEMGVVDIQALVDVANFVYRAELGNGLVEHELDHVLVASATDITVVPNPEEVLAYRWWPQSELQTALEQAPEHFTAWFPQVLALAETNA
ncbi:isopentenyl-diphosphate Delta-isomerase [Photobacterium gaetbulicola]|uniref:Isopentenyl-diphosphate Delta-isomerase n=1 Tax=Photobacterium gaetbulicola Gung47 TaxID=658445 RepID=A0A0C5WY76_9GAMM|nr:isopentenyl-diphosphate Delta-isomerase [Photobacterium gaetbulicola]AJR09949.1 isopentenyldiphosphate isomerase [Photobacterium gaetbulicola Gung47]PSU05881.1 isopentenyl-diphosphate Delta-isomerase [Photobacterium gaetbulicola]